MPAFSLNSGFDIPSSGDKLSAIESYLYMLVEQLRYTLSNLDRSNINTTAAEEFAQSISKPLSVRIEEAESGFNSSLELTAQSLSAKMAQTEERCSTIEQTVDSISFEVVNGEESSVIKLTKDGAVVNSQTISLSGYVRFSDLSGQGNTSINGSNITTGTIKGVAYYASGIGESFVVTGYNHTREIGGIRYDFVDGDGLLADKMYLYTSAYFDGYSFWRPSVKVESVGNISIEAPDGLIYMKSGSYATIDCAEKLTIYTRHYVNSSPVVTAWEFTGGALYKNGVAVL